MNYLFIKDFFEQVALDLKKISYRTKGEFEVEDLENEVYFLLEKFVEKHGREPDAFNIEDKGWVLSRLNNQFVKWTDHNFKNALRINSLENDDGENWILELPAPENSSPLTSILLKEKMLEHQQLIESSYSEAKAYVVTFGNFDYDKKVISGYFYITPETLSKRFDRAIVFVKWQPSLFDAIEFIDDSFNPIPGQAKVFVNVSVEAKQFALHF